VYNTYFGFDSRPFRPEGPETFYHNPNFDAARTAVLDGIRKRRGFILLTGEAGVGKTLVLRRCIAEADDIFFILLVYANLDFPDILKHLCENLQLHVAGLDIDEQSQLLLDALAARASRNQAVALLIDDAQNIPTDALLHLQALVETPVMRLQRLQIVLAGLPEFADRLEQAGLQDLGENIQARYHLERLSHAETRLFIEHQLKVAGYLGDAFLSPAVIDRIGVHCKGIPRAIAKLCDAIFSFASARSTHDITPELVDEAAQYFFLGGLPGLAGEIGGLRAASLSDLPALPAAGTAQRTGFTQGLSETADISSKRSEQLANHERQTMPWSGSPQDRLPMDAEGVEPRLAAPLFMDGLHRIQPIDTPTIEEKRETTASGNARLAVGSHPWLTRLINPRIEKENPMTRLDQLTKILKNLQNESPGVEASALISEDGLMIASSLPQDLDETRVAGMTATLLNLGTRAATELHRGDVQEVIVRGEHGYSVMISAGRGALLLVLTNENSKLGLIFFDMREAIKAIKNIL
jgi:predicted regulator of Ras-like GTPase activity (Roadblock/LC7/MglB family)/type II secretory pathway predicted ATPase ExeA